MRPQVYKGLSADKVRMLVPRQYKSRMRLINLDNRLYCMIVFALDRNDVVKSRVVRKALEQIDASSGETLIAVGAEFTLDALVLLSKQSALIVSLSEFMWTDASYDHVRQL